MFNSKIFTTLMVLLIVLAAGVASAGDANWSFYGKVHSSINMMSNGENSQLGLSSNSSRYGFKGDKALNDDFTFVWQVEQEVNVAQGELETDLRNTFVGFRHEKAGEVRMGRHDTPHKTLGRKATFFFDTIGDNRQMTYNTDGALGRLSDILAWVSPDWSGFALFLAYQFDQDGGKLNPAAAADAEFFSETLFSGMASYTKNEFFVGASMTTLGEGYNATGGPDRGDSPSFLRFAGKYDAEKFGLAASYLTGGGQEFDGTSYVDMTATTIGFEGLFRASEKYDIKAGYYMADPNTDADDDDYSMMTVGVDRNFGKSTQVYIQYAGMSYGDAAGNPQLGGNNGFGASASGWMDTSTTPASYKNPTGFSFGVAHKW